MFKNLVIASFLGLSAVVFGAFGAHALKETLTPEQLQSFETAVRYQMYHTIVMLFINIYDGFSARQKDILTYLLLFGILCFSGSIYVMQITSITAESIWFVTPLGGLFFILAWVMMIVIFLKKLINK